MAMGCPLWWYHVQTVNTAGCWIRFVFVLPLDEAEKTVDITIDLVETVHIVFALGEVVEWILLMIRVFFHWIKYK